MTKENEFFVWEEKNLNEQKENLKSKKLLETNDFTRSIDQKFLKKEWKNIGEIKKKTSLRHQIVIGKKYNRLTALELVKLDHKGIKYYRFKCECGIEKIIPGYQVNLNRIKSCGCIIKKNASKMGKLHRHKQLKNCCTKHIEKERLKEDFHLTYHLNCFHL